MKAYIPMGSAKGYNKKMKRWFYGWHWVEMPYTCFDEGLKPTHYIRVQVNLDWNLTDQEDVKIEPDSVGYYIGNRDINNEPLFLGDIVKFKIGENVYEGTIAYNAIECYYFILTKDIGSVRFCNNLKVELIGNKYKEV